MREPRVKGVFIVAGLGVLLAGGCGSAGTARTSARPEAATPQQDTAPAFVNRIWRVQEGSDIPAGSFYVFLSDQTLLITSPNTRPAIGRWLMEGSELAMIEEGFKYRTEILELQPNRFVIRQHNPAGTVRIVFAPAALRP